MKQITGVSQTNTNLAMAESIALDPYQTGAWIMAQTKKLPGIMPSCIHTFISEADLCNAPDGCEALLLCGMPAGTGPFLFVLPVAAQDVPSVPHIG